MNQGQDFPLKQQVKFFTIACARASKQDGTYGVRDANQTNYVYENKVVHYNNLVDFSINSIKSKIYEYMDHTSFTEEIRISHLQVMEGEVESSSYTEINGTPNVVKIVFLAMDGD